jgi:hypothetical protein
VQFDAIVVGAGVGGLYAIFRLRQLGLRVRAFEAGLASAARGIGTVIQVPLRRQSMEYSYSFSDEPQQEWHWPSAARPEILRYINYVVDRYDLYATSSSTLGSRKRRSIVGRRSDSKDDKGHRDRTLHQRPVIFRRLDAELPRLERFRELVSYRLGHTTERLQRIATASNRLSGPVDTPHRKQATHLYVFSEQRIPACSRATRR